MKTISRSTMFSVLVLFAVLLSACRSPSASVAKSDLQRVISPNIPTEDSQILVNGNNAFALDMYRSLRSQSGNLILSPYSISLALGMTYAGARGGTESQMAKTLHYDLPQGRLHPAFNGLDQALTERGRPRSGEEAPFQLSIANSVWAEQSVPFQKEYLDVVALNYGAGIQLADFVNQPEAVRKDINRWVGNQTKDKIKDMLQEGTIKPDTKMALVNAIYFKADWAAQFEANSTHDALFHLLDGAETKVRMMSEKFYDLPYIKGDGFQAIELAYQGRTAAMYIIVPDEGSFAQFESILDSPKLGEILSGMQSSPVELGLPKFNFTSDFNVSEQLKGLGMTDAFDKDLADFSGMTGNRNLYIDNVVHKAFVAVDEKGTEAAAATVVLMAPASAPPTETILLTIDRPFIFLIRDIPSGQILFIGRVLNPSM